MTGATVLGPWPGRNTLRAQQVAFAELGDTPAGVDGIPPLVHLPMRGEPASTTARTAALLDGMPTESGPHGWKFADRPGGDLASARAILMEDFDALEFSGRGWRGPLLISFRGPWSMAAALWLARGDRVLSDRGAVSELTECLAEGIAGAIGRTRAAVPGAEPVLVLREPNLPDVLAGVVPTFSGHDRLPAVSSSETVAALDRVIDVARRAGATRVAVHGGTRFAMRSLVAQAGTTADAVAVAVAGLRTAQWESLAPLVERGTAVWVGLPREHPRKGGPDIAKLVRSVAVPWREVGLPSAELARLVVHTDTSGAGDYALSTMQGVAYESRTAIKVAAGLAEVAGG